MIYRERVQAVLFKIETISGQDANPSGPDAVRTKGFPVVEVNNLELNARDDVQTGLLSGADPAAAAGWYGQIDIPIELTPSGLVPSAVNLPFYDALWRASGLARVSDYTVGTEQHQYRTIDQSMETGTCWVYSSGKLIKLVGCVANPKIAATVNQVATVTFTVKGKCTSIQESALPGLTFPEVAANAMPPVWNGSVSNVGGPGGWLSTSPEPLMLLTAAVDLGNVVTDLPSAGAADGLVGFYVSDRAVTQDLSYYVPTLATHNPFDLVRNPFGTITTLWTLGTTKNYKATIECRWKPTTPKFTARNGTRTYEVPGVCKIGSGLTSGREFQVTFS